MNLRRPFSIRALILALLLVAGPIKANVMFACDMMDTVVHVTCCCEAHDGCASADCDDAQETEPEPCCDVSSTLSIDQETEQKKSSAKTTELRSHGDLPSVAPLALFENTPRDRVFAVIDRRTAVTAQYSGSRLYLSTQRLRI